MKGEQIESKVREIKFPQYIINEKFKKNENKFYVFILEFGYFIWFLMYFFKIKNRKRVFILFGDKMDAIWV